MNTNNLNYLVNSLYLIKPELVIAAFLVLLVLADLIWINNTKILPYIAIIGLLTAGYFLIDQFGTDKFAFSTTSSAGMFIVDPFGSFF